MAAAGSAPAAWQGEILRAFQAWAETANINVGVVADNNSSYGAAGRPEGDPRFGDIRVFARPLADAVLAVTTPPGPSTQTGAGDIIINSNITFGAGAGAFDLYTAILQEAGHALGVGNNPDPASVMYEFYRGPRAGLSVGDASAARALYGPRAADAFEGTGNGTIATAKPLASAAGTSTRFAAADLADSADADTYSFVTPASVSKGVTVSLTAGGLSLAAAGVTVSDAAGQPVAAATAAGPGGNLTVAVPNAQPNAQYFVRVAAAPGTPYAAGRYQLRATTNPNAADPLPPPADPTYASDAWSNETVAAATQLSPVSGTTSQIHYEAFGRLGLVGDKDVYAVPSPVLPPGVTTTLVVRLVPAAGDSAAYPRILTAAGQPADYEIIATDGAQRIVQVKNVASNTPLFVEVARRGQLLQDERYAVTADYRPATLTLATAAAGTLTPANPTALGTLHVNRAQVLAVNVDARNLSAVEAAAVWYRLYRVGEAVPVATWIAIPGTPVSDSILVEPGEYAVRVTAVAVPVVSGGTAYEIKLLSLTDPIGIGPTDPNGSGNSAPPPDDWSYSAQPYGYYTWQSD